MSSSANPDLTGQVAIVTGSGGGIGRATALALAAAGAAVAVVDMATHDTAAAIQAAGGHALDITLDVTDQGAVESMVHQVEEQFGAVDLLANAAAIALESMGSIWEVDPDKWWRGVNVNLRGQFLTMRAVLPGMIRRRKGRIINWGSGSTYSDQPNLSAYCSSKAAVARLAGCAAEETREYGIAVFSIDPGLVRTPMTEAIMTTPAGQKWMPGARDGFDSGVDVPPEVCARLVVQLASGKADACSGHFIGVEDDLDELILRADEITRDELFALKVHKFK
jgi:3-oxoacyl-[acyl-carrier protein] reductase